MPPNRRRVTAEPDAVDPDEGQHDAAPAEQDPAEVGPDEGQHPDPDSDESESDAPNAPEVVEPAAELPFISAGVQSDLDMRGWAGDPATGGTFRKDKETGEITYTPRQ